MGTTTDAAFLAGREEVSVARQVYRPWATSEQELDEEE